MRFAKIRLRLAMSNQCVGPRGTRVQREKEEIKNRSRTRMRREKRQQPNDPEGGNKKRKEVVNDNSCSVHFFSSLSFLKVSVFYSTCYEETLKETPTNVIV